MFLSNSPSKCCIAELHLLCLSLCNQTVKVTASCLIVSYALLLYLTLLKALFLMIAVSFAMYCFAVFLPKDFSLTDMI